MGVASGCSEQEAGVGGIWLLGMVVRRYIDFLILLIPTRLVSVIFYSSIPTFCSLTLACQSSIPIMRFALVFIGLLFLQEYCSESYNF